MKYANITEIRNGYIDLDLLKSENIKSYIGCVFLNASGAPFDAFGYGILIKVLSLQVKFA